MSGNIHRILNLHTAITIFKAENGGVLDYLFSSGSNLETINDFKWDNCLDGNITQNGWLISSTYENGGYYRDLIDSSYSADYDNGERVEIAGQYGDIRSSQINPYIRNINRWINKGLDYSLQNESVVLAIHNADTTTNYTWFEYNSDVLRTLLQGSFQLNSALTSYRDIDVATDESFYFDSQVSGSSDISDWTFTDGVLEVMADDGSALRLKADSGDVQIVEIILMQDGVDLETFQQPWSLWRDVLINIQRDPRD